MSGPKDLERLLSSMKAEGADFMSAFAGLVDDPSVELTEAERSRERIIRAFTVAAVEGVNAECERGMAAPLAIACAARAAGIGLGLLLVQACREAGWARVRKEMLAAVRGGMIEIERHNRGEEG